MLEASGGRAASAELEVTGDAFRGQRDAFVLDVSSNSSKGVPNIPCVFGPCSSCILNNSIIIFTATVSFLK